MRKMPRQRPKQTNKNELWDEVEEVLEDYVIKRPLYALNTSFGQGDTIPIKQEIIKEPFGKDNGDVETLSYENNPMIFDEENAKKETKQTNKNELWDEVEEVL